MGFKVFGVAEVLSVHTGEQQDAAHVRKQAHRAVFSYVPKEGFVYIRSRMISSRCNDNFDMFPAEEIEKSYETFLGKPVFVNHHNSDHRQARGVVIAVALHKDRNPDGSPDTWTEGLMEVDGITYPKLAIALINGDIDRTSMGCDVQISKCSVCDHVARNPLEYCRHIPGMKGKTIYQAQSDGRRLGKLVYETCYGLSFFENSLLVEPPADPTAFRLGPVVVGPGLEHVAQRAARLKQAAEEPEVESKRVVATLQRTAGLVPGHEGGWYDEPEKPKTPEQRAADKEKGRQLGEKMFEGFQQIMDPGSTPESRASTRNIGVMNTLQNHGYQPHHIKFDDDDDGYPYAEVEHRHEDGRPSGWYGKDYGGSGYLHIMHRATGDDVGDMVSLEHHDPESRSVHRIPGYGPTEAHQDLSAWHDDDEGQARQYLESSDPRIKRWQMRHRGGMERRLYADHPSGYRAEWTGGNRFHVYEGDYPVDSPPIPGYGDHLRSSEAEEVRNKFQQKHLQKGLNSWVKNNGTEYMDFNHGNPVHGPSDQSYGERHGFTSALQTEAAGGKSKGDRFFETNKIDPAHIINAFNNAKDGQKAEGMDWYQHIHRTARMITGGHVEPHKKDVVGGDPAKGAGLLAVYSGQSGLSDNHWKAAKVAVEGRGLGGSVKNGDPHAVPGFFADKTQAEKAQRILNGEHHSSVLGDGSPKTSNFAHLIEHGGDDGSGHTAVCVDRHALSVGLGRRITDQDFGDAELSKPPLAADKKAGHTENHRYRVVADAYRHAANELSGQHGIHIAPHQVQAVTWVVQRDMNNEVDSKSEDPKMKRLIKGRATNDRNAQARWFAHVQTHYPEFGDQPHWKMTMKLGYNETFAPEKVDTLRDEQCPICGNDIAFDGRECAVCGYIQPPKALDDPDVEKAKQLDQLRQNVEDQRNESGLDPSQPGADFDAGDLSQTEPGGDNSNSPWLECTNCGTGLRPSAPQTSATDPAQQGAPMAEGDPCPMCGEGQLMSTGESEDDTDAEQGDEELGADEDPDAPEDSDDEDDEQDEDEKKSKKNPAVKATAAMKYRDHSKEFPMQNGLASLAKLNAQTELQAQQIKWLRARREEQRSQIQRLTAGLKALAQAAGPQADAIVRTAMIRKRADEQNPAQPIPEPAPQPPSQTTVQAETPEAFADVRAPGMVPGVNQDVAADAVTTAYTPGQDIAAPAVKQLVDVTAPVEGTQGPRPTSEVKTNVDVRVGPGMNPQTAFPLGGPFANAQRTGSAPEQNELRTMASIRLARLQKAAGIAPQDVDDLVLGQAIAANADYSMERINTEIATLNQVRTAAAQHQMPMPPRGAVPRPAGPTQRIVPPLGSQNGFQTMASSRNQEDADLSIALM